MSGFDKWLSKVDEEFTNRVGLTSWDLPDQQYYEMFESDYSPDEVVDQVLDSLGF